MHDNAIAEPGIEILAESILCSLLSKRSLNASEVFPIPSSECIKIMTESGEICNASLTVV